MEWKDTGDTGENSQKKDPYYDDDGYGAFKKKGLMSSLFSGHPINYLYWGIGAAVIIGVVLLAILLLSSTDTRDENARIAELQQRVELLERQLEKVNNVDEKVTHIWEQAKAFEIFKSRFDRSEASTSLRMDHLAMSLDAMQKKNDDTLQKINRMEKTTLPGKPAVAPVRTASPRPAVPPPVRVSAGSSSVKTHTVVAGDTLYSISRRYNLTVPQLRSLNNLGADAVIQTGQKLFVQPGAGQ